MTAGAKAHVDRVYRLDATASLVLGWLWDPARKIQSVSVRLRGEESTMELAHYERPDVLDAFSAESNEQIAPGFVSFVSHRAIESREAGALIVSDGGGQVEIPLEFGAVENPFVAREALVEILPDLCSAPETLAPFSAALGRVLLICAEARTAEEWVIGPAVQEPRLSIVVPVYGELDLVESQLNEFCSDPEFQSSVELIYVIDDPRLTDHARTVSQDWWELYRVPCRFLALAHNAGFGGATNEGARRARADLLMLLNSDVIPTSPGWVGKLIAAFRRHPDVGLLSPKLVFEDGSLQHAGLYWAEGLVRMHSGERGHLDIPLWHNHLYYKGHSGQIAAVNDSKEVPGISAACMLMTRALYDELGGLDETYVQGDCEDSDLCLRVAELGRRIVYEPAVELYHLEGQSYPSERRQKLTLYNIWLQDRRWRGAMRDRMAAFPPN